jgi:hypothetical protein
LSFIFLIYHSIQTALVKDKNRYNDLKELEIFVLLVILLLMGTYSCLKAIFHLSEPGLGQEIRNKMIKKQVRFVLAIFVFSMPSLVILVIKFIHSDNPVK